MSLQFIIGNSGSGKTEYMYRRIVKEAEENPRKNYLVLVPEQFTLQTQRKLVDLATNHAILNIDVLSFKRLAYRVFDELGVHTMQVLEETGKNLVLRKVAQEKQEQLTVLRPNISRMGYIGELKSLLSELMQYNISWEQLNAYVEGGRVSRPLGAKLRDVVTMYRGFLEFLEGSYVTAEEILTLLGRVAPQSKLLQGAVMAFDEFTGFTPIQNQLLSVLLPMTDRIMVTLTMDAKENFYHSRGPHELFDMPKQTIGILLKMAKEQRVPVLDPVILSDSAQKRFAKAPSLAFMEQNLFRSGYKRRMEPVEEISIASLKNPKEELIYIAREINRLVREGYRYREIAVVTGSVETYQGYIDAVFAKYQIPYFLDATTEILFHPFIEFIRASLEVIRRDFSYESIFRFLRCGFCGISEEQLDRLENYLLATGIRGYTMWSKRWLRLPKRTQIADLEEMEQLRQRILGILSPLAEVFRRKDAVVEEELFALYEMIVGLDVEAQLNRREKELLEMGAEAKSREYGQIYSIVMELLDKYAGILGQERMDIRQFVEVLDAGFDAASVASLPPGYDSITLGDIQRTRLNHIKVLFFIGVNDGIIPKSEKQGGIISQYEREQLKAAELPLAPSAREQTFIQRYYLYLNLTKPSEKLYVSCMRVDQDGKSIHPSYLMGVLMRMFPQLERKEYEDLETIPDYSTVDAAMDYLIYGEKDEAWMALAKWFSSGRDPEREKLERMLQASFCHHTDDPVSRVVAEALYGRHLEGSVTRLERFAACAYAHFLQYGLTLRERERSGFESVDMGNLYHAALERYSRKLEESPFDWFTVDGQQRDLFAEQSIHEVVEEYPDLSIYATAANSHMVKRMEHIFKQTVWALTTQVRKGRFVPAQFEISFYEPEVRDALTFSLGDGEDLSLRGRIDRLDVCRDGDRIYVKVIDYKSGRTKFDLLKIYQGTQLQLMVYMNAAMELVKRRSEQEVVPGGILYYHIDDPVIEAEDGMTEEEAEEALLMQLRPEGLVNREEEIYRAMDGEFETKSDVIPVTLKKNGEISESVSHVASGSEFETMREYVNLRIAQAGKAILEGDITVNPYRGSGADSSCRYCPYAAVCGVDGGIEGYHFRRPEAVDKKEIFEKMETEIALWK